MRRLGKLLAFGLVLAALGSGALWRWRTQNLGPVERGYRLAGAQGCFGCHGPGGLRGLGNPGAGIGGIPSFSHDDVTSLAKTEAEIAEWIRDGMPERRREELLMFGGGTTALLVMPAYGDALDERAIGDLVAYVKAVSSFRRPDEDGARQGQQLAARLGCFNCHGPEGRRSPPNPGALKSYIPAWDGADFGELARDEAEVREWILDGVPERLRENPFARFFMQRQRLSMPAYRDKLEPQELERLLDYIRWVRRTPY